MKWTRTSSAFATTRRPTWRPSSRSEHKLGGKPVGGDSLGGQTEYKSPVKDVKDFIAVAQTLEDTGVTAYDGAMTDIHKPGLQTASATIATVEARHASYLRLLTARCRSLSPSTMP